MGDIADACDVERFLRSREGRAVLENIGSELKGKTIVEVTFSNEIHLIAVTLHLNDGSQHVVHHSELNLDVLRERFDDVLDREYFIDYPDRKPADISSQ